MERKIHTSHGPGVRTSGRSVKNAQAMANLGNEINLLENLDYLASTNNTGWQSSADQGMLLNQPLTTTSTGLTTRVQLMANDVLSAKLINPRQTSTPA